MKAVSIRSMRQSFLSIFPDRNARTDPASKTCKSYKKGSCRNFYTPSVKLTLFLRITFTHLLEPRDLLFRSIP